MGSSDKAHPVDGANSNDQAITAEDRKLLDHLAELWRSHAARDLGTRHETGRLLNERFGLPTESQPQGQQVMKKASEELAIAMSDISRMRKFAYYFVDLAALQQAHPDVTNWTRLKDLLPRLTPDEGGDAQQPAKSPSRPSTRGVAKAIASLTAMLNRVENPPVDAERETLLAVVQELAEAASRCLKIRVKVADGVRDSKKVAVARSNEAALARATAASLVSPHCVGASPAA